MAESQLSSASLSTKAETIFRGLWASIFYTAESPPTSVLVCSTNRGEGATTVACALALAGAGTMGALAPEPEVELGDEGELDLTPAPAPAPTPASSTDRVILVDLNLRNPAVHSTLGLPDTSGVSDVLSGASPLADALRHVGAGKLDVLTAGTQRDRLVQVLQSDRVAEFLADLKRYYGHIIIDAAPPNLFPDARVLAGAVKSVVLVASAQQTARESLSAAKKALVSGGGDVLGVVLNKRTFPIPRFVYRRV